VINQSTNPLLEMKNKQKLYFVLNLLVLIPLFFVMFSQFLSATADYFRIQSVWIDWLLDSSIWYIDIILDLVFQNSNSRGGLEAAGFSVVIVFFQAIASLGLIIYGYFSRLLRGTAFKIMLGIYVVCWLLFLISIPIQERTRDRILDKIRYEYLDYIDPEYTGETVYIYPSEADECLNKYFVTTDRGINNPRPIELKSSKFTPKDNADDTTLNCFSDIGEYYFGLIQFSDISEVASKKGKAKLADMGIELLHYVHENAFIAKFDKSKMADRKNDILATDIRWFGSFKPEYKDSRLKESTTAGPTVKLQAMFFGTVAGGDKERTLEILKSEYNATILFYDFNNNFYSDYVSIEVPVEEMRNIAKLSTIQYVSYQPAPLTPH